MGITTDHTYVEAPHTDTDTSSRKASKIQKITRKRVFSGQQSASFFYQGKGDVWVQRVLSRPIVLSEYTWQIYMGKYPILTSKEDQKYVCLLNSREIFGILLLYANYSRPVRLRVCFVLPVGLQNFSHCYEHMDMHLFSHFTFQGTQLNRSLDLTKTFIIWLSWSFIWCFKTKLVPVKQSELLLLAGILN